MVPKGLAKGLAESEIRERIATPALLKPARILRKLQ